MYSKLQIKKLLKRLQVVILISICMLSISVISYGAPKTKLYTVNFDGITLEHFAQFIQDLSGKNVVYDPSQLQGKISIKSKEQMSEQDILEVFTATLTANNLVAIDKSGYIQIVQSKNSRIAQPSVRGQNASVENADNLVDYNTAVIQLKKFNVNQLSSYIRPLVSQTGSLLTISGMNTLIIKDSQSTLNTIYDFIRVLDNETSDYDIRSIILYNSTPRYVKTSITTLSNSLLSRGLGTGAPILLEDNNRNALIFIGSPSEYLQVVQFAEIMDSGRTDIKRLSSRVYKLKYASADSVYNILNTMLRSNNNNFSSASGSISFDKDSNSIVAIGNDEFYAQIESVLEQLDNPRDQVYIEALILETSFTNANKFGIEWSALGSSGNGGIVGTTASPGTLQSVATGQLPSLGSGLNLGIIGNSIEYNGKNYPGITALVNALQNDSGFSIISNPQILSLDNSQADFFVGSKTPILTSSNLSSSVNSYEYEDVGTTFTVVPHIAELDAIILDMNISLSQLTSQNVNNNLPTIITRNTNTSIKIFNDSIIAISGMVQNTEQFAKSGVPILSKIPILGYLFRSESNSGEKDTVTIFMSAKIVGSTKESQESFTKTTTDEAISYSREINKDAGVKEKESSIIRNYDFIINSVDNNTTIKVVK